MRDRMRRIKADTQELSVLCRVPATPRISFRDRRPADETGSLRYIERGILLLGVEFWTCTYSVLTDNGSHHDHQARHERRLRGGQDAARSVL